MLYKEDWLECREWLTGWWNREVRGHPAVAVTAPRESALPFPEPPEAPSDQRERWLDTEGNLLRTEAQMAKTYYGGAAFPYAVASLGPGALNIFCGSEPVFMPETVWYQPCFADPGEARIKLLPDNVYWQWTVRTTTRSQAAGRGKFLTAMPDLIEGLDVLSELLGTEELLTYLIDCPDEIQRLLDEVNEAYFEAFDPLYDIIKDDRAGNAFIAFNAWGPGKTLKSQCDFSAMISPDMFAEFVSPHLERQCARADFSVYHLDGPGAMGHLEHLVRVPSLNAVQWTPGYPNPASADPMWWEPIWRQVYDAGKSAMVHGPPETLEPFLKEFGQKGTLYLTSAPTEREARKLLDDCVTWGA